MISTVLARWITHRPLAVALVGLILTGLSAWIVFGTNAFDSDILNLLPAKNPAVQGLKIYNEDFTQNRELAFLLTWKTVPENSDELHEKFLELLRKQPWVQRILDAPPLESGNSQQSIREVLVPLLLNLPPAQFQDALAKLQPAAIQERVQKLASQTKAGSPLARFELENDPLGLVGSAVRPVSESVSMSDTFDLSTRDGSAIIIPVITKQADNSQSAASAIMAQVRQFMQEARAQLGPNAPEIGVTGRSAYVDEIAQSMNRDIIMTASVSLLVVTLLFWVGFRRIMPLIGISLILAISALSTMAGGTILFTHLNVIAISFCSILFGLGDDFSLLLCQRFFQCRSHGHDRETSIAHSIRDCAPGILWVAFTTGIGFLALCFSGSSGFAQLGVLVALGVLLCALFMPVFLFLFVGQAPPGAASTGPAKAFVQSCLQTPRRLLIPTVFLFSLAILLAILPWRSLVFDTTPASLEPRNMPAANTLASMMARFPGTFEPLMVVLPKPDPAKLSALDQALQKLKADHRVVSTSSPSALVLDPSRTAANQSALHQLDLAASRASLESSLQAADITIPGVFTIFDDLSHATTGPKNWHEILPPESPWWFLLDRMVATNGAAIAYIKVPKDITAAERVALSETITAAVPDALVTGWSQALVSLIPWAQHELIVFGSAVAIIVLTLLAFLYRNTRFWLLHTVSLLAAGAGTVATLKLFNLPINLLNVLAFPLMLGVGVDYGTHIILAVCEKGDTEENLAGVVKAIALSGLTTAAGFGALILARNPALSGLGALCGIGVIWCLLAAIFIVCPAAAALRRK